MQNHGYKNKDWWFWGRALTKIEYEKSLWGEKNVL